MRTEHGAQQMRAIAEEACALVKEYKGSYSGEHGDGLVRSEWIEPVYGARLTRAFGEIKRAFDPKGLMNPGKIVARAEDGRPAAVPLQARLPHGRRCRRGSIGPSTKSARRTAAAASPPRSRCATTTAIAASSMPARCARRTASRATSST